MKQHLRRHWQKLPRTIRRPIVLLVGLTLILTSGAIGWLPGPGGIPVFLLGVFVLASEFQWADDFGRIIMQMIRDIGAWARRNPLLGAVVGVVSIALSLTITVMLFMHK